MKPFAYSRAASSRDAIAAVSSNPGARFLAGGTNLLDLMKEYVEQPDALVDVSRLPLGEVTPLGDGGLRIGSMVSNTAAANHPQIRTRFPVLSEALLAGATGQIRNKATMGGNLLQRTRCPYFYDTAQPCNKREPGSGCGALEGINRVHAIFGASDRCVATYPGDMAQGLLALDAVVQVEGPAGRRSIPMADFHRLPGDTPQTDTTLRRGELITAVDLPGDTAKFAARSHYLKARERASYAFALVSVAAALDVGGDGRIRDARVVLGSVAHKPWRSEAAERVLRGGTPGEELFRRAGHAAVEGARPLEHNRYKVELGRRAVARALTIAAEGGMKG